MATLRTDTSAPSTPRRQARPMRRRARQITQWTVGGLLALAGLALSVTAALDYRDLRRPPPGELVQLADGRLLHLQIAGVEHAGPTVVLEAGQGMFSPAFAWLQQELAKHVTVVSYDRPGYGWSTPADRAVDAGATVDDLHAALSKHAVDGPYLLVGHSLGAFYVRTFAERYPDDTLGLVLLDPADAQQRDRLPADAVAEFEQAGQMFRWAARVARLGLFRLSNPQVAATTELPEAAARQIVSVSAASRYWKAAGAEIEAFDTLAAAPPRTFGDLPVMIISAGKDVPDGPQIQEVMNNLHRELASRIPQASHVTVDGADHLTLLTVDGYAHTVGDLIVELVQQALAE